MMDMDRIDTIVMVLGTIAMFVLLIGRYAL